MDLICTAPSGGISGEEGTPGSHQQQLADRPPGERILFCLGQPNRTHDRVRMAEELQRKGFYALPVRPPTIPEGTSRIRFSLTADVTEEEVKRVIATIRPVSSK